MFVEISWGSVQTETMSPPLQFVGLGEDIWQLDLLVLP